MSKQKPKTFPVCHNTDSEDSAEEYVNRFSLFTKFIHVMARVRSWFTDFRARHPKSEDEGSEHSEPLHEGSDSENPEPRNEGSDIAVIDHYKHFVDCAPYRKEIMHWVKWAQRVTFASDLQSLEETKSVSKGSRLRPLDPFLDSSGVMRVGGRLGRSLLPDESVHPIILPSHNSFVEKLVLYEHVMSTHAGAAQTLGNLRAKYWVVHTRQEVRRIIHFCITCRTPSQFRQKMAQLPLERVNVSRTFSNTGTDFAGPLYIRTIATESKVWIAIFTCMASRAVHLEVVEDSGAEAFLRALERMMNRRGKCALIVSDNALAFKKSASVLSRIFSDPKTLKVLEDGLKARGIEWRFITERAPWHGGFYERLVKSVKIPLRKILGKAKLSLIELQTVLTEIEAMINSRPLTDISADKKDASPLTPAHLLVGHNLQIMPDIDSVTKQTSMGKRWQYRQSLCKAFWNRWVKEYVPTLLPYKKWTEEMRNAEIGQLVLISDEKLRRHQWTLGRIVSVQPGRDGLVRSVMVKTAKGQMRRPVQKLYQLECAKDSMG